MVGIHFRPTLLPRSGDLPPQDPSTGSYEKEARDRGWEMVCSARQDCQDSRGRVPQCHVATYTNDDQRAHGSHPQLLDRSRPWRHLPLFQRYTIHLQDSLRIVSVLIQVLDKS